MAELRDRIKGALALFHHPDAFGGPGTELDHVMAEVEPVLGGWRRRALDAEAARNRVRQLAEDIKTEAHKLLGREPVENGISAGERYEAEVDLAVAERVLAALNGQAMER
jgi:hypothetical protein